MASRRPRSNADLAIRRRGGLHRAGGDRRVVRTITARRKLATRTVRKEHDRAEQRLSAALAEQHWSSHRHDAATGRAAGRVAEVALHTADQEVAARDAWLRWVDDEHYHGLNAGPFELLAEDSGP